MVALELTKVWTLSFMRRLCQCPITASKAWKMYGYVATVCIRSVVTNIITSIITPTVMTPLQHVPGCETDI
jgi:hypothetical protein